MSLDRRSVVGIQFAQRVFKVRTVGCALSLIFVATTTGASTPLLWGVIGLNGLLWPYIAYRLALRSSSAYLAELRSLRCDCLFAGGWIALMQFSVLPSLLLLSMVAMNCVTAKGIPFLLRGLFASVVGMVTVGAFTGFAYTLATPVQVIWACLPMLVIYPLMIGIASYNLAGQLLRQQRALSIAAGFDERMLMAPDRWLHRLGQIFLRCRAGYSVATVAHIRIDEFELLSGLLGELVMDALSTQLGHLIKAEIRNTDLVCMTRSGTFLVLLHQAKAGGAQCLMARIEDEFSHCVASGNGLPDAQIRVGLAEFTYELSSENEWLALAEQRSRQPDQPSEAAACGQPSATPTAT